MTYCTLDDLVNRFGLSELVQLTDESGVGVIDSQIVNAAIEDASHEIDGYLGGRYTLPLSTTPKILVKLCANIARHSLYDNAVPDVVKDNYTGAIRFLTAVAKGQVRLGIDADGETPATDDAIEMESAGSVFSRANAKDFI